jgi:hypothetical protein
MRKALQRPAFHPCYLSDHISLSFPYLCPFSISTRKCYQDQPVEPDIQARDFLTFVIEHSKNDTEERRKLKLFINLEFRYGSNIQQVMRLPYHDLPVPNGLN